MFLGFTIKKDKTVEDNTNTLTQEVKPPDTSKGLVGWLRDNLFSTWYNTILTCLGLVFLFFFFRFFFTWVFTQANWAVIPANLQIHMIGSYPIEQVWRIGIVFCTLLALLGFSAGIWRGMVLKIAIAVASVGLLLLLIPLDVVKAGEDTSATLEFNLNIFYLVFVKRIWLLGGLVLLTASFLLGRDQNTYKRSVIIGWALSFPLTMIVLRGSGQNADLQILMLDSYPTEQIWRIGILLCTLSVLLGLSAAIWRGTVLKIAIAITAVGLLLLLIPLEIIQEVDNASTTLKFNPNIFYLIFFKRIWLLGGLVLLVATYLLGRDKNTYKRSVITGWILSFPLAMIILHGFGDNTDLQILMLESYTTEQVWRIGILLCTLSVLLGLSAAIWRGIVLKIAIAIAAGGLLLLLLPLDIVTEGDNAAKTLKFNFNIINFINLIFLKRIWLLGSLVLFVITFLLGRDKIAGERWVITGWVLSFPLTMIVLREFGKTLSMTTISTAEWGGLLITLILAAVGIIACFPIGVLLALGRRSQLPAIRWVSTVYIETIRGVPLITILFMVDVLLPIFMYGDFQLDTVIRVMVAFTLFSAAYMAENVRGGLQAIPSGQVEAAQAVGLTYSKTMMFIVLPQAIRAVIPAIVGQSIALFKDTSLVFIVGLTELMGIRQRVLANPDWGGLHAEVSIFVAIIYFVFSYSMSIVSQKIEGDLGVGKH